VNSGLDFELDSVNVRRLQENLEAVQGRIARAAVRSCRSSDDVKLVAVTKQTTLELARSVVSLGVVDLGENYPQELWTKATALEGLGVRWHLIGHLQSNKVRRTLPLTAMIHAVDSLKLLRLLDDAGRQGAALPQACLQVNCSNEPAKHGWTPEGLIEDCEAIAACGHVPIVGLMTMAALGTTAETARPSFQLLRQTRDLAAQRMGLRLRELSMGMSNDYETAVEEGATLVRVGSALWEGVTA
jgi:pyridoxal phosphate enzyme (YggS family)